MVYVSDCELHVNELNGFYNAIRCVLGIPNSLFGASLIYKGGESIDQIVKKVIDENIGVSSLISDSEKDFKFIQKILDKYLYAKLDKIGFNSIEQLDWNLIEYYGLVSTAEDENGPWNRLVGQKHRVLEYTNEFGNIGTIFFVEHQSFVVMTYLAESE